MSYLSIRVGCRLLLNVSYWGGSTYQTYTVCVLYTAGNFLCQRALPHAQTVSRARSRLLWAHPARPRATSVWRANSQQRMVRLNARIVSPVNIPRFLVARATHHALIAMLANSRRPVPPHAHSVLPPGKQLQPLVPRPWLIARSAWPANLLLPDVNAKARSAATRVRPRQEISVRPGPSPRMVPSAPLVTFALGARHFRRYAPPAPGGSVTAPSVSKMSHNPCCCGITLAVNQIVCVTRGSILKVAEISTPRNKPTSTKQ